MSLTGKHLAASVPSPDLTSTQRRTRALVAALAAATLASTAFATPAAFADGPGTGKPWVVSVGDSYISGEAGRWAGNTNLSSSRTDALGPTAYYDNATHTAETIPGCHRSTSAEVHIGDGVQGMTIACSGATTVTDATGTDFKPGLDFYSGAKGQGQARMLESFAKTHNVKLVPLSVGGNNFKFGTIVTQCVTDYGFPYLTSPSYCMKDPSITDLVGPANVAKQTAAIKTGILNIRQAMRNAGYADSSYKILVQNYEGVIPSDAQLRYPELTPGVSYPFNRVRQRVGGCGFWNNDAIWAMSTALPRINAAVRNAAAQTGLANIRLLDLSHAFQRRELCAKTDGLLEERGLSSWKAAGAVDQSEWVNQIRTLATIGNSPYYLQESLHPNYWGQLALRNCVRQAYNGGVPRGGTCTIAGTGLNAKQEPRMILSRVLTRGPSSAGAGNPKGGGPATARCASNAVLVGVTLRMNGEAGSATGICRPLAFSATSVTVGSPASSTARIGRGGTRNVTASCPTGTVITGFSGRSGLLVDAVKLRCRKLMPNGTMSMTSATPLVGGTGGSPFAMRSCPSGMATGLAGRAGDSLDYLALECSDLS